MKPLLCLFLAASSAFAQTAAPTAPATGTAATGLKPAQTAPSPPTQSPFNANNANNANANQRSSTTTPNSTANPATTTPGMVNEPTGANPALMGGGVQPNQGVFGNTEFTAGVNQLQVSLGTLQGNIEQALPVLFALTRSIDPNSGNTLNSRANQQLSALQQQSAGQNAFIGTIGTNSFTVSPQTLQMLVVMQNDLQKALPIIRALNGSTGNQTLGTRIMPFNNVQQNQQNLQQQNLQQNTVTPTGR